MNLKLSTFLLSVAVIALLSTSYLQYRHIDALNTELNKEKMKTGTLQKSLVARELASMTN